MNPWIVFFCGLAALALLPRVHARLRLSKAKHPSLRGHALLSRRVAKLIPFYEYDETEFFCSDDAPSEVVRRRREGFERLEESLRRRCPTTLARSEELEAGVSDVAFTNAYRVPFQYRNVVRRRLKVGYLVEEARGSRLRDLDGNWAYDLTGAYGMNVFGMDFYKQCIGRGVERVGDLGPVLGLYHPVIAENVDRLKAISGLDEVSFHMSGTEAVMQAVRLARYHTGRSHIVRFCGAYHGWWDGVQGGVGNPRPARELYTLKEMDEDTLYVLRTRKDIACVLVNPLQALHPNGNAPSDAALVTSERSARYDRAAYTRWLERLRDICAQRSIVLIFDEVFMGFRLAYGGAQEYFGVRADMVTYGKTLGGGLPVGVLCGRGDLMRRFRDDRPLDICFARGTFNSHPYVMAAMNEFLRYLDQPGVRARYAEVEAVWNARASELNRRLEELDLPVRVVNMASVWTPLYLVPSRYNWMFQYYLREAGLALSWIGTGRFIFGHHFSDEDVREVADRFVAAAEAMKRDGWWWQADYLTNKWIKRRVMRETVRAAIAGKRLVRRVEDIPA